MRLVRGAGDFGIRKAFPAAEQKQIAIKNGWIDRTKPSRVHINCLAIGDTWTMGVMVRYPIKGYSAWTTHVRRRHLRARAGAHQLRTA